MASRSFMISYISSSFTKITIPFISINFAVLWNAWLSNSASPFRKCRFLLSYDFLKKQTITFFISFLCLCFEWPISFLLSKTRIFVIFACYCYLCRFYHECAFELIVWLILLVHWFCLVHLNKHHLVEILLTTWLRIVVYLIFWKLQIISPLHWNLTLMQYFVLRWSNNQIENEIYHS